VVTLLSWLTTALNAVNNPTFKAFATTIAGAFWKSHPETKNRAFPVVALVVSLALGTTQLVAALAEIAGFAPAAFSDPHALSVAVVAVTGKSSLLWLVGDMLFGSIAPVLVSIGAHSGWKNFVQWAGDGYGLIRNPKQQ